MEVVLLLTVENIISTSSFKQLSDQLSPQTDEILKNWTERGRVPNTPFRSANATNSGRFFFKKRAEYFRIVFFALATGSEVKFYRADISQFLVEKRFTMFVNCQIWQMCQTYWHFH